MEPSNTDAAPLGQLVLNGVSDNDAGVLAAEGDHSRASDVDVVTAGGVGADLKTDSSVNLDEEHHCSIGLVLGEGDAVERSHRDVDAGDERRPDVDVLVALVNGGYGGVVGDLLALVGGVGVELVVVDAELVVWVAGDDGDLDCGGEEVRG